MTRLLRVAIHEAAHCVAAITFGVPIIKVCIDSGTPCLLRGHYRPPRGIGLEAMCILALSGPASEQLFCGPITDGSELDRY